MVVTVNLFTVQLRTMCHLNIHSHTNPHARIGQERPADSFLEKPFDLKELARGTGRFLPMTGNRLAAVQAN